MFSRRPIQKLVCAIFCFALVSFVTVNYLHATSKARHKRDFPLKYSRHNRHTCTERRNIVYIKMIKCASETLASMFRRFGYLRNLSFVLPYGNRIYLGWPFPLRKTFYRPSKTGGFNMMVDHVVYNENVMSEIMPSDTAYITSIREPYAQVKSTINYYRVLELVNISHFPDPLTEYFRKTRFYDEIYKSPAAAPKRYCIPDGFSMTKNLMSFNLGLPLGFPKGTLDISKSPLYIADYLLRLKKKFTLVMIFEYLHESLVLLRRLLCWTIEDILYFRQNRGIYSYKKKVNPQNVAAYKAWSPIDYIVYDFFNTTLWEKIKLEGPDFYDELRLYNEIQREVEIACKDGATTYEVKTFPASKWGGPVTLTPKFCSLLKDNGRDLLLKNYNKMAGDVTMAEPSVKFC